MSSSTFRLLCSASLAVAQVQLTVPFSRTSFSTTASFEVRSPKRLQVRRLLAMLPHAPLPLLDKMGLQILLEKWIRCYLVAP